jgi:protein-L-isoaspartate(D-aspartate) O-methyltransferase
MQDGHAPARGEYAVARRRLSDRLREQGIRDERVLAAIEQVPRHRLVDEALGSRAYGDTPLPIGAGQTISAPGVVAAMTEALNLRGHESVLEIGTGSGYQAAVLSRLASRIVSIERIPRLASSARKALDTLGVTNVVVYLGDGTRGWPDGSPFDRIVVTAGGPEVPPPLLSQLVVGGVLVGPFGARGEQNLLRVRRAAADEFTREVLGRCQFVDLIGANGWAAA